MSELIGGFGKVPDELKHLPRMSPSKMGDFFDCPYKYYYNHVLKKSEPTKAMEDGTMIHMAILEPEKFERTYAIPPKESDFEGYTILHTVEDIKRELKILGQPTKGNKKELSAALMSVCPDPKIIIWDDVLDNATIDGHKQLLTEKESEMIQECRASVNAHPWLSNAIKGGVNEQLAWWYHERTGVIITMRLDYFHLEMGRQKLPVIIDLKKVRTCEPRKMSRDIASSKKYLQAAMYVDGIKHLTGKDCSFVWACVEGQKPFISEAFAADFGMLEAGRAVYEKQLNRFIECYQNQQWPAYSNGNVMNISLPHWEMTALDEYAESELENE